MDRSARFQDSKKDNYRHMYRPLTQQTGPNQQFQGHVLNQHMHEPKPVIRGQPLSQPMAQNQPFQGEKLSQPMGQNQPFLCEHVNQSMGQKQPFQGQPLSQPMGQNQSFQAQPLSQYVAQNMLFHSQFLNQPMGQTQPFLREPLSQPFPKNQPLQGEPMGAPMGKNQPFHGQPLTQSQQFRGQPFSQPKCENLSYYCKPLSQPVGQYQPLTQSKTLCQPMSQNHPFQGKLLSQPRDPNQPCQSEPSPNILSVQASSNMIEHIQVLENKRHGNCLNWTDEMARLLIIAVSYITEAESFKLKDEASRKKLKLISKMTKWKVISTLMSERGFNVSAQQCEEKFRDIKNKYKQMIRLLGRATSCNVVENPILLDSINMPENKKEEVRKLLHSEQFLYREMCSFHHGNRMFLPHDWDLLRSVFLNLANNCDDHIKNQQGNHNGTGQDQNESKVLRARVAEAEEKSLELQDQMLQLEKERFEWFCYNRNEDLNLEKMRLENESLKLENAKLAFELKHRQNFCVDDNR